VTRLLADGHSIIDCKLHAFEGALLCIGHGGVEG